MPSPIGMAPLDIADPQDPVDEGQGQCPRRLPRRRAMCRNRFDRRSRRRQVNELSKPATRMSLSRNA